MDNTGNESAFPGQPRSQGGDPSGAYEFGLTKRELFAAMMLQGALTTAASPALIDMQGAEPAVAEQAVKLADALLAELAKVQP